MSNPIISISGYQHEMAPSELHVSIDTWNGCVRVSYGCDLNSIAMSPRDAVRFAQQILNEAETLLMNGSVAGLLKAGRAVSGH